MIGVAIAFAVAVAETAQTLAVVLDNVRIIDGSGAVLIENGRILESGFSPLEAISAATTTAAAFLYRSTQVGSLRPGLNADLVVLRGQPDRDVSAIRTVDRVMVAGRWIDIAKYGKY